MTHLLVGTYTGEPAAGLASGVVPLRLEQDTDGARLVPDGAPLDLPNPSYLTRHPSRPLIYAVTESDQPTLTALGIDPLAVTARVPIPGRGACHVALLHERTHVLVACYGDGTIVAVRVDDDGRPLRVTGTLTPDGSGQHPRQSGPHAHHVLAERDGSALVTDLGGDVVRRVRLDPAGGLHEAEPLRVPPGTGPRQTRRNAAGLRYVLGELSGELLTYAEGYLIDRRSAAITEPAGENLPAHLLLDGDRLYASHRGHDRVSVFDVAQGTPAPIGEFPTGAWPRHIAVDDGWLYTADQYADRVTARRLDAPGTVIEAPVRRPSCVLVAEWPQLQSLRR